MQTRQFSKDLIRNIKSVQKSEADDFKKEWRASLLEIKKEIIEAITNKSWETTHIDLSSMVLEDFPWDKKIKIEKYLQDIINNIQKYEEKKFKYIYQVRKLMLLLS